MPRHTRFEGTRRLILQIYRPLDLPDSLLKKIVFVDKNNGNKNKNCENCPIFLILKNEPGFCLYCEDLRGEVIKILQKEGMSWERGV